MSYDVINTTIFNTFSYLNLFDGKPLIEYTPGIILLMIIYPKINNKSLFIVLLLIIFNISSIYVLVSFIILYILSSRKIMPKQYVKLDQNNNNNNNIIKKPIKFNNKIEFENQQYDHVLIGNDISILLTACLLSKVGHKVIVLNTKNSPKNSINQTNDNIPLLCPVYLKNLSISNPVLFQNVMDIIQSDIYKDNKDRITLSTIGSSNNYYLHTILNLKQNLYKSYNNENILTQNSGIYALHNGENSIVNNIGKSNAIEIKPLLLFINSIKEMSLYLSEYYFSKVFNAIEWSKQAKTTGIKNLYSLCALSLSDLIKNYDSIKLQELFTAISCIYCNEVLDSGDISGIVLSSSINDSEKGMYYPIGGYHKMESLFCQIISSSGGVVYSDVPVESILIDSNDTNNTAVGVIIKNDDDKEMVIKAKKSIVSGLGLLCTFNRLISDPILSNTLLSSLSTHVSEPVNKSILCEKIPLIQIIYWIDSSCSNAELDITDCDYIELNNQIKKPDNVCQSDYEEFINKNKSSNVENYIKIWSPSCKDSSSYPSGIEIVIVEIQLSEEFINLETIPTNNNNNNNNNNLPKVYYLNEKEINTNNNNSNYGVKYKSNKPDGITLEFSSKLIEKIKLKSLLKLREIYPLTANFILDCHVEIPVIGGHYLSNNKEKYTNENIVSKTNINNLFLCNQDLSLNGLEGEINTSLNACHSILGYTYNDLYSNRNILTDLSNLYK